jgi:integrase
MVVTDARNSLEAKRIGTNIKFLVKTGQWESLDEESLRIAVRLYQNRGWKIPQEIFAQFRDVIEQEITLQDAARLCYQDPFIRTQSSLYKERLKQCFKNLFKFRGPTVLISTIDIQFIKEYMQHRINEGAAMDTIKREKTALGRIFQTLVENRLWEHNPVRDVKWRENKKATKKRRPFLCLSDFWKLYGYLPEYCKALVLLAYMTGMRQGEVRCLILQQLDLPARMIRLTNSDTKEGNFKRVPLRKEIVLILEEVLKNRNPKIPSERVFLRGGHPMERFELKRPWESARSAAGFASLRFHDLRHSWKTHALSLDQELRMAILGHSGGTHEGYGHISDERLREAIDSIDFGKESHSYGM